MKIGDYTFKDITALAAAVLILVFMSPLLLAYAVYVRLALPPSQTARRT